MTATEFELQSPAYAPPEEEPAAAPTRPPWLLSFLRKVFAPAKRNPAAVAVPAAALAPPAPAPVPDTSAGAFETGKTAWAVAADLFGGDKDAAGWLLIIGVVGLAGYGVYRLATRESRRQKREEAQRRAEEERVAALELADQEAAAALVSDESVTESDTGNGPAPREMEAATA